MVNTMEIFLFWFGVTRMALYTEKDILVKYNKRKLCLHYECVIHVITVFFYGEYDGNISILIFHHQDGLEHRDHPDGVQQEKLMFPLWTCYTFYNLIFYGKYYGNMFILIWNNQDGLERREEHPGGVQQDKTWYIMAIRYFMSIMETSILNYLFATGC